MLKLLICLIVGLIVGGVTLQLRARQLELRNQVVLLEQRIQKQNARLWSQQVEISLYTSPKAVSKAIDELPLAPQAKLPAQAGHWVRTGD